MDKYTVDLDQVLNDLEYSELTDQHDKNKVNNIQNSSTSYVHNNFKNTNIKHSINNVFHSLNEYLSTDISTKCDYKPVVQEPCFSADSWKSQDLNAPTEQNDVADSAEATEIVETLPSIELPETPDLRIDECKVEDILVDAVVNNNDHEHQDILSEETLAIAEENTVVRSADHGSGDILIVEEEVFVNTDELSENIENFQVEDVTNNLEAGSNLGNAVEIETNAETFTTQNIETQLETALEENKHIKEEQFLEIIEENTFDEKISDGLIKVGFDDEIDLDDSDLNQYLDEVEQEYNTRLKVEDQDAKEDEEEKFEECSDKVDKEEEKTQPELNDDSLDETSSARPNKLPLVTPESGDIKSVIDLVGEPGSTPYNNVYVNKELTQEKHKDNSDIDYSTSASPTFSDISTETNSSCTPSTDTVNDENLTGAGDETSKSDDTVIEAAAKVDDNTVQDVKEENNDVEVNGDGDKSNRELSEVKAETPGPLLGNEAPLWIPDAEALSCMHCDTKFTVIKRRHHCRACGYVLCSKCCNLRYRLEYLEDVARVCNQCYEILSKDVAPGAITDSRIESNSPHFLQPNPNNPLEYCSTLPPHQQVSGNTNPPAVMVPVGVLKRKGSNKARTNKSVMFCDGIRPGSDLTNLDSDFTYTEKNESKMESNAKVNSDRCYVAIEPETNSFIPKGDDLPPTVNLNKTDILYSECSNGHHVVEMLKNETLMFALQTSLFVHTKIINMDCCINKLAWCFSTEGLINVGQDEIVIILELLDDEKTVPKDIFLHINSIYQEALKGTSVKELGISLHYTSNFLGSKNHAGFVYIRPTFQCMQNVIKPQEPYLIGILIHRWETPWAKLFPLRLILRLGAEYRYYPSPLISNRYRDSVFVEIGHTIINLLADFRNFSYTLPQIRGLTIHMEDKNTTIRIPSNRYDQVLKSMNNSSDHILAFAGNFSSQADSHLVCIQDTQSNENAYSTHAINIHNKPRKVTGASFIVFNGALKSSSGLTAKSSIVEDGLMIQIPSEQMVQVRESLRNMKNFTIQCGCINAASDETVNIEWGEPDINFNINVCSPIDNKSMEGIPSIRVHNGKDYTNGNRLIRWTEVFIIQNEGEVSRNQDPIDISKVSETIAKATCTALVKYLDLLVSNNFYKIGIRTNLNAYFVAYSAGSNATILPPIYMESLDNELVPVLHRNATNDCDENTIILELIFRILNK